jgi:hypothetical protein
VKQTQLAEFAMERAENSVPSSQKKPPVVASTAVAGFPERDGETGLVG